MKPKSQKAISTLLIILAGEVVFMLPFLIPRLLRPMMIESWGISNTTIGLAFSAYGFTAVISYLLGGPIADKFSARLLISASLALTAIGGIVLYLFPGHSILIITYAYFGASTTLLMWSALIKVTHNIGGNHGRAKAMGVLDAGRGLSAAIVSSIIVWMITQLDSHSLTSSEKLAYVYLAIINFSLIIAILIFFLLTDGHDQVIQSDISII